MLLTIKDTVDLQNILFIHLVTKGSFTFIGNFSKQY